MSHSLSPSTSSAPSTPSISPVHDFTTLISALQEATQALIAYSQACESIPEEHPLNRQNPWASFPSLSNKAKRRECHKDFHYRHSDNKPFADKSMAQFFEQEYKRGNFRDEIRYYYVPAALVQDEYKFLRQYCQNACQKSLMDIVHDVHTELDLRSKLLAYITHDASFQNPTLTQISESIVHPLQILQTIHAHVNKLKLIHKRMLPPRPKQHRI